MLISWLKATNLAANVNKDRQLAFMKKLTIKALRIMPNVQPPENLKMPEAILLRNLTAQWLKRVEGSLADMNVARMAAGKDPNVEVDDLLMAIKKLSNIAIVLMESDSYYQTIFMDFIFMICGWYQGNVDTRGKDFLSNYKDQVNKRVAANRAVEEEHLEKEGKAKEKVIAGYEEMHKKGSKAKRKVEELKNRRRKKKGKKKKQKTL
jgi:hypothetical protein